MDIEHFKVIIPQKMLMQTGRTSPKTLCPTTTNICIKHKLHHSDTSELINPNIQKKKFNVNGFFYGKSTIYFFHNSLAANLKRCTGSHLPTQIRPTSVCISICLHMFTQLMFAFSFAYISPLDFCLQRLKLVIILRRTFPVNSLF